MIENVISHNLRKDLSFLWFKNFRNNSDFSNLMEIVNSLMFEDLIYQF